MTTTTTRSLSSSDDSVNKNRRLADLAGSKQPNQAIPKIDISVDPRSRSARKEKKKNKKPRIKAKRTTYQFVDRCRMRATGGTGGNGCMSSQILARKRHLRPDGGHGGDGGSVIVVADPREQTLGRPSHHVAGKNGYHGTSRDCHGARGQNTIVRVPMGVVVKRVLEPHEIWDEENKCLVEPEVNDEEIDESMMYSDEIEGDYELSEHIYDQDVDDEDEDMPDREERLVTVADLDEPGSYVVVAKGGKGGTGTCIFSSRHGVTPSATYLQKIATPTTGEVAYLELELKMIADLGLVGFPNAGKSSLLRAMSRATPAVAPYPFTTLHPLMGYIEYRDGFRVRAADIPGLIDGAAQGRGKGHEFLRHVERTKALLYIVDAAGVDNRDPVSDLEILAKELATYGDGSLMDRRALVVANKVDLLHKDTISELAATLEDRARELGLALEDRAVISISAGMTGEGLGVLSKAMRDVVTKSDAERIEEFERNNQEFWALSRLSQ